MIPIGYWIIIIYIETIILFIYNYDISKYLDDDYLFNTTYK